MRARVDPPVPGLGLEVVEGTELDERGAQEIACRIRTRLQELGYPGAEVRAELRPTTPGKGDLSIRVKRGRAIDMSAAVFEGDLGVAASELRKALNAARARTPEAGVASLQSFYYQHGYFRARVRAAALEPHGNRVLVRFEVQSGLPHEGGFEAQSLCRELFAERRKAEQAGIIEFRAALRAENATAAVERGPAYEVGRIEFLGNHTVRDAAIRRALLLDEGALFDRGRLRRSLARLNRTGLFEPLGEDSLTVNTPPGTHRADLTIRLRERKKRHWYVSGPVGPISLAGPLELAIGSRLPSWGQGVLEVATYSAALHFMLLPKPLAGLLPFLPKRGFLAVLTIQRSPLPGQPLVSGFTITPQFGWRGLATSYGVSQTRTLLSPLFQSRRALEPPLAVSVGEGAMYCTMPTPALDRVRQVAGVALNVGLAIAP